MHHPESPPMPAFAPADTPARNTPWPTDLVWSWLLAAAAAALSLVRTGSNFNVGNNAYHIPIVLRFEALPQFADDPFVLSLRDFVSPVYPLLSLVATEDNVVALFLAGSVCVHLLTFFALLRIAQACGIGGRTEQAAFVFLLAATRAFYQISPVGADGLLHGVFSHTELARAVALLAIAELLRGRPVWAGALTGLAFALNAFVGIWTLVPVAVWTAWHLATPSGGAGWAARSKLVLLTGVAFAVPALPVAVWIARVSVGTAVDFDYRAFLEGYYPAHFLPHVAGRWRLVQLACALLGGGLAAALLDRGRGALLVFASLVGVFVAGVLVGLTAESRLLLNLHLLRVDGLLILLSTTFVAAATVTQVRRERPLAAVVAPVACLGLFVGLWPLVAAAMLLAHGPRMWPALGRGPRWPGTWAAWPRMRWGAFVAGAFLVAVAGGVYARTLRHTPSADIPLDRELGGDNALVTDWLEVKRWARQNTPAEAVFLVPSEPDNNFRTGARRRIWVSGSDGAAAMWAPSTFHAWHRRREEVRRLDGLGPSLAYACARGLDYVVLDLRPRRGEHFDLNRAAFANKWFEVHAARCETPG